MRRGKPENRLIDLTGRTFGRLTVSKRADGNVGKRPRWTCVCSCGKILNVRGDQLKNGHSKSCGCWNMEVLHNKVMEKHPMWKGGRRLNNYGYVQLIDPTHPNATDSGRVLEHHAVMSKILGRPIDTKVESVHHKNGIRTDNRPEDLELFVHQGHGFGQRVEDLVEYTVGILKRYAPNLLVKEPNFSGFYPNLFVPAEGGGRWLSKDGYVWVYKNGTKVLEHREVMSKMLERPLTKDESVHHKNGIRSDNRPENLELRSRWHGFGQKKEDVVNYSVGLLGRYFPDCVVSDDLVETVPAMVHI